MRDIVSCSERSVEQASQIPLESSGVDYCYHFRSLSLWQVVEAVPQQQATRLPLQTRLQQDFQGCRQTMNVRQSQKMSETTRGRSCDLSQLLSVASFQVELLSRPF